MTSTYLLNAIKSFVDNYRTDEKDRIVVMVFDSFGNMVCSYDLNNYAIDAMSETLIITEQDEYSTQVKHIDLNYISRLDLTLIPSAMCSATRPQF